jgi:hypothetical protein
VVVAIRWSGGDRVIQVAVCVGVRVVGLSGVQTGGAILASE